MRAIALSVLLVGCANDPVYLQAPMTMEAGTDNGTGMLSQAQASLQLPIKTETAADKAKRDALAAQLGVDVPYVRIGDLEIDVEWTIKNLDTMPGQAKIQLNGANELFSYDPTLINLAPPDDEEAPKTPGLDGDIPIDVPAGGTVSGLFTEDQLREASIDLDQVTRGNVSPFRAVLTVSKNALSFQPLDAPNPADPNFMQTPLGPPIPREAFAEMIRVDLVFKPSTHMTLDFNVRVRDVRGILHDLLLAAETDKPGELQTFMPMAYTVGGTPAPAVTARSGR
ncbi:MAG TPA: hypothetical protein VIX73_14120 [Kofleriaceae bacterium]|jgi:hypothetical protein